MALCLDPSTLQYLVHEIEKREALQAEKVFSLASRLHPKLTAEDLKNPHDFSELNDIDWHFEDGQLTAYQAILTLLRCLLREVQ